MLVSDTQIILQDGRRKNWFWESNSIFDCNLSCYALVVRLYLARCAGENRVAFPSISNIAAHGGISPTSAPLPYKPSYIKASEIR
jgi:hypothetical protein